MKRQNCQQRRRIVTGKTLRVDDIWRIFSLNLPCKWKWCLHTTPRLFLPEIFLSAFYNILDNSKQPKQAREGEKKNTKAEKNRRKFHSKRDSGALHGAIVLNLTTAIECKHPIEPVITATEQTLRFFFSLENHYSPPPPIKIISISTWKHLHCFVETIFVGLIKNHVRREAKSKMREDNLDFVIFRCIQQTGQKDWLAFQVRSALTISISQARCKNCFDRNCCILTRLQH